ncbi:MAG TPA: hypothetical protein VN777_16035, partial [Terriglobales bacterium]|nr:hypothetical protein [Terriglobales bacterium]HZW96729.1 hypothetical protein [Candidatus Eremiobacteraceae bacterium]
MESGTEVPDHAPDLHYESAELRAQLTATCKHTRRIEERVLVNWVSYWGAFTSRSMMLHSCWALI